jgi:hypothetical protein
VYLYVPPGHQKNWAKHCARYAACGQPVYFVQERWVVDRNRESQAPGFRDGRGTSHKGYKGDKGDQGRGKPRRDKHAH